MGALLARFGLQIAGAALAVGAVAGAWLYVTGLQHDNATLSAAFTREQLSFRTEHALVRKSEGVRGIEHTVAVTDASGQGRACTARVEAARQSATTIATILQREPAHDPHTLCPVVSVIGAGELRGATRLP